MIAAVKSSLMRQPVHLGAYFAGLSTGALSKESFIRSQKQFYFAVRYFSRPMAALMARMPDSASRQALMHNLAEEHGYEESRGDFRPTMAHDHTFLAFLQSLGVDPGEMREEAEGPEVLAFNLALMGACSAGEPEVAFACLGIIEYSFADLSAIIGRAVVERGWVRGDKLVHYALHAEIDKEHAAGFFRVVEHSWNAGGTSRCRVEQGLSLGLYIFHRLYEDLACLRPAKP
ncbi:MAG TPA: iron-containing redox enzyme family protein [Candidatus Saccharimonadia bacterium]|nr:iron-containing redox enzyme family protein [Candidatus Saccharimonadia bacterium]